MKHRTRVKIAFVVEHDRLNLGVDCDTLLDFIEAGLRRVQEIKSIEEEDEIMAGATAKVTRIIRKGDKLRCQQ